MIALHRTLGVWCSLMVLLLTITGLMLVRGDRNQSLDTPLSPWLIKGVYGLKAPEVESRRIGGQWISLSGGTLFWGGKAIGTLEGELMCVDEHPISLLVLTDRALALISKEGEWIDGLTAGREIPLDGPLTDLRVRGQEVELISEEGGVKSVDLMNWTTSKKSPIKDSRKKSDGSKVPEELRREIELHGLGHEITWERFLLDLHSGRLLGGAFGMVLMEVSAWGLILLTFSGLYIWLIKLGPQRTMASRKDDLSIDPSKDD